MIRVGGKQRRGVPGSKAARKDTYKNIDVTSGSNNIINGISAKTLSPLVGNLKVVDNGMEFQQFENWWQGNKVYIELGHYNSLTKSVTPKFRAFQNKWAKSVVGKRRPPEIVINRKALIPAFAMYNNYTPYDYKNARFVYLQKYCNAIKKLPIIQELVKLVKSGQNIMIIDNDGPWSSEYPEGLPISWEILNNKIRDVSRPFGHGYVVAIIIFVLSHIRSY